jgi:hypothetical protein
MLWRLVLLAVVAVVVAAVVEGVGFAADLAAVDGARAVETVLLRLDAPEVGWVCFLEPGPRSRLRRTGVLGPAGWGSMDAGGSGGGTVSGFEVGSVSVGEGSRPREMELPSSAGLSSW